jgi:hypothetical protein
VRIVQRAGLTRLAGVVHGLDVRRRAGEEDAVHVRENLRDVERRFEHGDQHRQAIGRLDHGGDVLFAHGVEGMRTNHASIGGDANDGTFVASHNNGAGKRAVYYLLRTRAGDPGEAAIRPQLATRRLERMQWPIEAADGGFQVLMPVCRRPRRGNMLRRLARHMRRE